MILEWIRVHESAVWAIGTISIITLVGTLIAIPVLVIHMPADYFRRKQQNPAPYHGRYAVVRILGLVLKNILGIVFVVAGLAMLLLPGQGIIAILIGIMLLNFPGKLALERRIAQQSPVLRAINWMRAKANRPALEVPRATSTRGDRGKKQFIKTGLPFSTRKSKKLKG
jgi:hypothetical protein